jgi:hypothetical protein
MCFNRENNSCCCTITIISSILGALGIAGIFYGGFLVGILPIVYITLVLGVLGILYILIPALCGGNNSCNNSGTFCLIPISVGAIISSAFALAITFAGAALSLIPILLAVAFFMIMLIINLVYIIINLLTRN